MKASIDEKYCTGCGLCSDICPEVFQAIGDRRPTVRVAVAPAIAEAACKDAARSCPTGAIELKS